MFFTELFDANRPTPEPAVNRQEEEHRLVDDQPTAGYTGHTPVNLFAMYDGAPPIGMYYRDMERMRLSPHVEKAMDYYKSGIHNAKFKIKSRNAEWQRFAQETFERIWLVGLNDIQEGYWPGHCGMEIVYRFGDDGQIGFDRFNCFNPLDVKLLKQDHRYYGIRVRNVPGRGEPVDLWGPDNDRGCARLPKAFWYVHRPRHGSLFGIPQPLPAWRPWRRLEGTDGAEMLLDAAGYRGAYAGAKVFFPPGQSPTATSQPNGMDRWTHRAAAIRVGDASKAGMTVAIPSVFDKDTGNRLWDYEFPGHVIDLTPLVYYCTSLEVQISLGVGVPPELIQVSEGAGAGGYNGREIPLEAYFDGQQFVGNSILFQLATQIVVPLGRWRYGDAFMFEAQLENLLEQRMKRTTQQGGAAPEMRTDGQGESDPPDASTIMAHAPAGGISLQGKVFPGGTFIPTKYLENASPEERAKIEAGQGDDPAEAGSVPAKVLVVTDDASPVDVFVQGAEGKPSQVWPASKGKGRQFKKPSIFGT